jgi:hypothetical protein
MMARIFVMVLLAKLRIGTGQGLEIPMLTGKILVRHIPIPLFVALTTRSDRIHSHTLAHASRPLQSPWPSSHRDLGSLLNRLASANCW